MRTEKEVRTEALAVREGGEWDVSDLENEMYAIRAKRRKEFEALTERLRIKVRELINCWQCGGPHWKEAGLSGDEVGDFIERHTLVESDLSVREGEIDMPEFDDYPVIVLNVRYLPPYTSPSINVLKFAALFTFEEDQPNTVDLRIGRGESPSEVTLNVVGKFEGEFVHVSLKQGSTLYISDIARIERERKATEGENDETEQQEATTEVRPG
jgi:hypothetical protein